MKLITISSVTLEGVIDEVNHLNYANDVVTILPLGSGAGYSAVVRVSDMRVARMKRVQQDPTDSTPLPPIDPKGGAQ